MTKDELIAKQAMELVEYENLVNDLRDSINGARLEIICIGGPLNDNKLQYSKPQLITFSRILEHLEEAE
jgi:hypothetical protein